VEALLNIHLLAVVGAGDARAVGLSARARSILTQALDDEGAELLRVWEPGTEDPESAPRILVVHRPPAQTRALLAEQGLDLTGAIPVVDMNDGPRPQLDRVLEILPYKPPPGLFTGELFSPGDYPNPLGAGLGAAGYSDEEILGLPFCVACGGWGKHKWSHP
jgi:hypothetical protein